MTIMTDQNTSGARGKAQRRWGEARVLQGLRDPAFLRAHREEIVARIQARGGARVDAQDFVSRKIAEAEGTLKLTERESEHAA